jgi:hypothetical protein
MTAGIRQRRPMAVLLVTASCAQVSGLADYSLDDRGAGALDGSAPGASSTTRPRRRSTHAAGNSLPSQAVASCSATCAPMEGNASRLGWRA